MPKFYGMIPSMNKFESDEFDKFDTIIVDEAQLFSPEQITVIKSLLTEEEPSMFLFADTFQFVNFESLDKNLIPTIEEVERNLIFSTLEIMDQNRTHTAKKLGISLRTLRNKLREYREQGYEVKNAI